MNSRTATLARGALACAALSELAGLAVLQMTLPPDDAAYGYSFAAFVLNPIVLLTGLALAITFGFLGFIDSLWSLAGADLRRAIPITILVTVISVAATATKLAALCGPAGLVAGMVSMRACRFLFPIRSVGEQRRQPGRI